MVHDNVHSAFHPNLLLLYFGNNLLIVRDHSGGFGLVHLCKKNVHAS